MALASLSAGAGGESLVSLTSSFTLAGGWCGGRAGAGVGRQL